MGIIYFKLREQDSNLHPDSIGITAGCYRKYSLLTNLSII